MANEPVKTGPFYPKWKYSKTLPAIQVKSEAEEKKLVGEWFDSPDLGVAQKVSADQAAAVSTQKDADAAKKVSDDKQVVADTAQKKAVG